MDAAGRAVAEAALKHYPQAQRILVLCGKGNNGGDGYVAARYLKAAGRAVTVLELASSPEELTTPESRAARAAWLAHEGPTVKINGDSLQQALESCELIMDALFGSGLSRPLEGELAQVVKRVNASQSPVLSIDVPSGLSADQATPFDVHIHADHTVQLAGPKRASVLHPACEAYGSSEVVDVGIPARILEAHAQVELLEPSRVRAWLPRRSLDTHKYEVGTVLVIAGSQQYAGAAVLTCHAAFRAGAGLVTLAGEARPGGLWPEVIFSTLQWNDAPLETLAELPERRRQVRVIGPGLDDRAKEHLLELIGQSSAPTVLDAEAFLAEDAWLEAVRTHGRCVLTPHAGEASRLLDRPTREIREDPLGAALQLARKAGAVTLLKGATTVIASHDGRMVLSTQSHPGMATGGTGDALAGVIGAFIASGDASTNDLFERTAAAVFVHGLAGKLAGGQLGDGLVASDVIDNVPYAVQEVLNTHPNT
jgi:hydroxyethylthiazole kinase-like uncharacterized protein yjeF